MTFTSLAEAMDFQQRRIMEVIDYQQRRMDKAISDIQQEQENEAMTDITETQNEPEEVSAVRKVFDGALNSIVQASHLAKVVADLEIRVNDLSRQVDDLRRRNQWLDEQLGYVRTERDQLREKLQSTEQALRDEKMDHDREVDGHHQTKQSLEHWTAQHDMVAKERDDAEIKVMELTEALDKANTALNTIRKAIDVEAPKPAPTFPEPAKETQADITQFRSQVGW